MWAVPPGLRPGQLGGAARRAGSQGDELDQAVVEAVEAVADQAAQVLVAGERSAQPDQLQGGAAGGHGGVGVGVEQAAPLVGLQAAPEGLEKQVLGLPGRRPPSRPGTAPGGRRGPG